MTNKNRKLISFTEAEVMKVEIIKEKEGLRSFSEAVRACVRQWHDHKFYTKHNDGKVKPLPEPELTQEQFCESVGGKSIKKNGVEYGFMDDGSGVTWSWPMSDFKHGYKKYYK